MIIEKKIVIKSKMGLHARPAALFVQIANKFDSDVTVRKGREEVNGKSIMGILMLAANRGSRIIIKAKGSDAEAAIAELEKLLSGDMDNTVLKSALSLNREQQMQKRNRPDKESGEGADG